MPAWRNKGLTPYPGLTPNPSQRRGETYPLEGEGNRIKNEESFVDSSFFIYKPIYCIDLLQGSLSPQFINKTHLFGVVANMSYR